MIGFLSGKIIRIGLQHLILDVHGVGYRVLTPISYLAKHSINDVVSLEIHTHVKEDQFTLFGFATEKDLQVFELLIEVSGIGPKSALTILNALTPQQVISAIQQAKVEEFTKISGLGKKSAQKIIVELQSKLGKISDLNLSEEIKDAELIEALVNLGFSKAEAIELSKGVDSALPLQQKIKLSLKYSHAKKQETRKN